MSGVHGVLAGERGLGASLQASARSGRVTSRVPPRWGSSPPRTRRRRATRTARTPRRRCTPTPVARRSAPRRGNSSRRSRPRTVRRGRARPVPRPSRCRRRRRERTRLYSQFSSLHISAFPSHMSIVNGRGSLEERDTSSNCQSQWGWPPASGLPWRRASILARGRPRLLLRGGSRGPARARRRCRRDSQSSAPRTPRFSGAVAPGGAESTRVCPGGFAVSVQARTIRWSKGHLGGVDTA